MLKKSIILIISLIIIGGLLMASCKKQSNISKPTGDYDLITKNDYNLNVKDSEGAIVQDYVDNSVTAQIIGDAVIKSIVGDDQFKTLTNVNISYDEANGIWLVNRNMGLDVDGGDYTCAVKKTNGEILKVWAGE